LATKFKLSYQTFKTSTNQKKKRKEEEINQINYVTVHLYAGYI